MTTLHNRSRLPRQDFLDTGAEVRHVEAEHAASEIDDDLEPLTLRTLWLDTSPVVRAVLFVAAVCSGLIWAAGSWL